MHKNSLKLLAGLPTFSCEKSVAMTLSTLPIMSIKSYGEFWITTKHYATFWKFPSCNLYLWKFDFYQDWVLKTDWKQPNPGFESALKCYLLEKYKIIKWLRQSLVIYSLHKGVVNFTLFGKLCGVLCQKSLMINVWGGKTTTSAQMHSKWY
jgi:hypothetical protein